MAAWLKVSSVMASTISGEYSAIRTAQLNALLSLGFVSFCPVLKIFLYRLLFVLYAESRGLLPAKSRGAGSNRRYREDFSLTRFIERLRDRDNYQDDAFDDLYNSL